MMGNVAMISVKGVEQVELNRLKTHPSNPRRGNIDAIAESLAVNGQYRPIVANARTNRILAGNHTYLAAKKLGWDKIQVAWVDVDDEDELRILLADNRTSDLASYDYGGIADILRELEESSGNLAGTGFVEDDLAKLVEELGESDSIDGGVAAPPPRDESGGDSENVKIVLIVHRNDEPMLRDALASLAYEIESLKIR